MDIHHIGYLVKNMDKGADAFKQLGFVAEGTVIFDAYRGVDICFMTKDAYRIELVAPRDKKSVVYNLQKKYGNSPYHICYKCKDILVTCEELRRNGWVLFDNPHEAIALSNKNVCFLIHPYLGMIELLEE